MFDTDPDLGEVTEVQMRSDVAERSLLGAVAFHGDTLAGVLTAVAADDFYNPHRGSVWAACQHLSSERKWIDPVAVSQRLAEVGAWNVSTRTVVTVEMSTSVSASYAGQHAATVVALARRRQLLRMINRARGIVTDHPGDPSEVLAATRAALEGLETDEAAPSGTKTWAQMRGDFRDYHTAEHRPGIETPWWEITEFLGGLHGGRMYVIGGAPGDGKSSAAFNCALHAALLGHQVLVYSAEMPTTEVFGRLVARGADVDLMSINRSRLSPQQLARIDRYAEDVGNLALLVNADNTTLGMIQAQARAQHHRHGLDMLVVDYLQLIGTDSPGRSAEEEIARISTAMKRLARELDCVVILPAQLNRNPSARADRKPTKSDLRGSGKIEQDADVVILLWHAPEPDGQPSPFQVDFIIDKNRQGPRGQITLAWRGAYGVMEPMAPPPAELRGLA